MKRFWNWKQNGDQRQLAISGVIAPDSWVHDDVSPQVFQDELNESQDPIDLWLNSLVVIVPLPVKFIPC